MDFSRVICSLSLWIQCSPPCVAVVFAIDIDEEAARPWLHALHRAVRPACLQVEPLILYSYPIQVTMTIQGLQEAHNDTSLDSLIL